MMLLNAEIMCAEGNTSGAVAIVNEIRERAGCDAVSASSADEALRLVKRERRLELMGEGVRWFDEVRYGTWKQDIVNMFARYNNPSGTSASNVADGRYLYPCQPDEHQSRTVSAEHGLLIAGYIKNKDLRLVGCRSF